MPRQGAPRSFTGMLARMFSSDERARELRRRLADGGFAGITIPTDYGGQGLTAAHQQAFDEEAAGYEMPGLFAVTFGILCPTLLDCGTEAQKRRHIPAMLRGDELWVQLLSEPTGGSDLAGSITRATRDGDSWVLNGSKVWSTGADLADYSLCLARTNWDVPKHRGLTMFIVPMDAPGLTIDPIRLATGSAEFCQEFLDDVVVSHDNVVGEPDDGWTVATRLLFHERNHGGTASNMSTAGGRVSELVHLARDRGLAANTHIRQLVAEAYIESVVHSHLVDRVMTGFRTGALPGPAGGLLKLFAGVTTCRRADIGMELAGTTAVAADGANAETVDRGEGYLLRQVLAIAGGSNEMQRNVISERLLGLPREPALDRDVPFSEVRVNQPKR